MWKKKKVWRDGFIYRIGFVITRREATVLLGAMCDSSWISVVVLVAVVVVVFTSLGNFVCVCLHIYTDDANELESAQQSVYVISFLIVICQQNELFPLVIVSV